MAAEKGNLDCSLKSLGSLIDMSSTARKEQQLATHLDVGPRAFGGVWDSIDFGPGPSGTNYSGPWIRLGMINNQSSPAPVAGQLSPGPDATQHRQQVTFAAACGSLDPFEGIARPTLVFCRTYHPGSNFGEGFNAHGR